MVAAGTAGAVGKIIRYEHAFGPEGFVDEAVFDPAGIGYAEADPAWALLREDPDFTYYWLGRDIEGDEGARPELVLSGAYVADTVVRPALRYRALLQYRSAEDEFGETLVEVVEWRRDEWEAVQVTDARTAAEACDVVDEYEVSMGRVTVYGPGRTATAVADGIAGDGRGWRRR